MVNTLSKLCLGSNFIFPSKVNECHGENIVVCDVWNNLYVNILKNEYQIYSKYLETYHIFVGKRKLGQLDDMMLSLRYINIQDLHNAISLLHQSFCSSPQKNKSADIAARFSNPTSSLLLYIS